MQQRLADSPRAAPQLAMSPEKLSSAGNADPDRLLLSCDIRDLKVVAQSQG